MFFTSKLAWCRRYGSLLRIVVAMACPLAYAATTIAAPPTATRQRPNILVIITDQQHAGMMSCAGNKYLKTPAMDGLAATGTRFELAYAANPVCVPSRVSMMTGKMPSHFGVRSNAEARQEAPPAEMERAMGWILRGAGYETAYGGKTHWLRGMTPESLGLRNIGGNQRDGLAAACAEFLGTGRDKPFLLVASFINPHDICYMAIDDHARAAGTPLMYPQSRVERQRLAAALKIPEGVSREEFFGQLCPPLPDNFEIPALEPECITDQYVRASAFRNYVRTEWSPQRWRLHRWAYCRLTEMVDAQIATVLDALRRNGLQRETVVIFTSDHGDLDAAHRLEHKSILYEEAARVPLIVSQPGVTPPGVADTTHLVSVGLDLIPTLCDYAGIDSPRELRGKSVRPLAEGREVPSWRNGVVVESKAGRMLRTGRFKYVVYESGEHREQLIDLASDPGEMVNLAEEAKYAGVLGEHRRALRRWVEQTGDEMADPYVPK